MDYKELIEEAKRAAEKWAEKHPIIGVGELLVDLLVDDLTRAMTELLARAEAAEAENKSREESSFREHSETHYWRDRAREAEKDRDHWREEALAVTESDLMKSHDSLSKEWAKEKKRADESEARAEKAENCIEEVNTAILLKSKTEALNAIKRWRDGKDE